MTAFFRPRMVAILAAVTVLGACHGTNTADLQAFVRNAYRGQHPRIEPIPVMAPPKAFVYAAERLPDPFSPANLETGAAHTGPRPDLNRPKGPLEHFPLDALKMVGTLSRHGERWAIIETPNGGVQRVRLGDHMGESYGTVTRITSSKISLVELIPGPNGGWVSRKASIAIGK
ncbi:MAG: pilus assembly protein PilP [Acidiferrobacteraceae bacterium]